MRKLAPIICTLAVLTFSATAFAADKGKIEGKVTAKKSKYVANTVVYLKKVAGNWNAPKKPAVMDQENQKFVPKVLPVVKGTKVRFDNSDNTGHNVFSPDHEEFDLGVWGKGKSKSYEFDETTGVYTLLCRLHPSMVAFVVVLQNPFFDVTDKDGSFEIDDVPPGTYTVEVWNERKEAKSKKFTVESGKTARATFRLK